MTHAPRGVEGGWDIAFLSPVAAPIMAFTSPVMMVRIARAGQIQTALRSIQASKPDARRLRIDLGLATRIGEQLRGHGPAPSMAPRPEILRLPMSVALAVTRRSRISPTSSIRQIYPLTRWETL